MSTYYIDSIRTHASLHIKQYGSDKFTQKKWRSEVRRGLTTEGYHDWAAAKTVALLGLSAGNVCQPPAPAAPYAPTPAVAPPPPCRPGL